MLAWGTVPDWLVAIGTVGAFWSGGWLLRREIRRDHRNDDVGRRAQAEMVSAWVEEVDVASSDPGGAGAAREHRFTVMNASDLPVYNVVIVSRMGKEMRLGNFDMGFIAPGSRFSDTLPGPAELMYTRARPVTVGFVDSAGRPWIRDASGSLFEGTRQNWERLDESSGLVVKPPRR